MGRRSNHTPEELRNLIRNAAYGIIESDGIAGLSAREIARRIGYSPGTIYNIYQNLDDVILHVEAEVLDKLDQRLDAALSPATDRPRDQIYVLARTYLAFTHDHPRLWNLLFEHYLPKGTDTPAWYQSKLNGLMVRVEEAMRPYFANRSDEERMRAARVLWASVHGITSLSTANKLTSVTTESAIALIEDLLSNYLKGLEARAAA